MDTPQSPDTTLATIREKTQIMLRLKRQRDAGKFRSVNAAIGLQAIENEIKRLRASLPPLTLVG